MLPWEEEEEDIYVMDGLKRWTTGWRVKTN